MDERGRRREEANNRRRGGNNGGNNNWATDEEKRRSGGINNNNDVRNGYLTFAFINFMGNNKKKSNSFSLVKIKRPFTDVLSFHLN